MKILVIEDERHIADFVRNGLREQGWAVDVCHNGTEGLEMASSQTYDAIVLDIMLPGRDGLSVVKLLRERGNSVPVLIITARGEPQERIEGLNAGADDYLPKPFYMEELIARLKSIWRRSAGQGLSLLAISDLTLNLMTREVRRGSEQIFLSPREFELLAYMMRSPGRVLTRTQIFEQVWEYHFDPGSNLVDSYIRRLRNKVDKGFDEQLIETIRGVGYRMKGDA